MNSADTLQAALSTAEVTDSPPHEGQRPQGTAEKATIHHTNALLSNFTQCKTNLPHPPQGTKERRLVRYITGSDDLPCGQWQEIQKYIPSVSLRSLCPAAGSSSFDLVYVFGRGKSTSKIGVMPMRRAASWASR